MTLALYFPGVFVETGSDNAGHHINMELLHKRMCEFFGAEVFRAKNEVWTWFRTSVRILSPLVCGRIPLFSTSGTVVCVPSIYIEEIASSGTGKSIANVHVLQKDAR